MIDISDHFHFIGDRKEYRVKASASVTGQMTAQSGVLSKWLMMTGSINALT